MTGPLYQAAADALARNVWEISTGNGRDLDQDLWDAHRVNCDAAVANAYVDGIDLQAWQDAALAKIGV